MASPNTGGYDQEFLDPPAKLKEFECPLCLLVTREPNLTSCCGQHFCQSCISRIITDRKPCPFCKELSFTTLLDKKQERKVLELKVNCSMKLRGCSWAGELRELDPHTDPGSGNCQFVNVTCPNKCGETCQRHLMHHHLSNTCPKRPFLCEYCNFNSTYEVVCKHYDQCTKFPLPCPNKCEVESVERGKMKEHLSECPLQLVDCKFVHAGCSEKIQRNNLKQHLKDNVQQHLLCAFTASQSRIKELEIRVEEKDRVIELLQSRVTTLEHTGVLPLVEFTVSNYSQKKGAAARFDGPTFYTHPRGVKVQVGTRYGASSLFYVELFQLPGEFEIKWPVKFTVTVHLLNQLGDHNHICGSKTLTLTRQQKKTYIGYPDPLSVPYITIEDYCRHGIRYLKDDCLKVRLCIALK